MKKLLQRGETIVEVLIVIMVLGSVLTSAFVVTRKATGSDQTAQERTEATQYAQSQIEYIRLYLASNSDTGLPSTFCLTDSDNFVAASAASPGCPSINASGRYKSYIEKPHGSINSYTETTIWENAEGGTSTVVLYYKPKVAS